MRGLVHRAAIMAAAGAGVLAAGLVAGVAPAATQPTVLYAAVTATGTGDCSAAADACSLSTALSHVAAGGVIKLITPGGHTAASRYVGNWTVTTSGTSATAPVTIEAAAGLDSQPVLDGDGPKALAGETCSTAACNGPVLTVPAGRYVALSGITIANANNTTTLIGGGLENAGTVTITGCTFTGNTAHDGGAIDNGDGLNGGPGTGSVTVTASLFTGNTAVGGDGGAIDSGGNVGGGGTVTVTASTFTGNTAHDGGAIDSGERGGGSVQVTASTFSGNTASFGGAIGSGVSGGGSVQVTASTFSGNKAANGGAIDSGQHGGGSVQVTASTFSANTASLHGGTIDSGDNTGGGTVQVAGDVFDGSCDRPGGSWSDGGYNAGSDGSCFNSGPQDVNAGSSSALHLGPLAGNGGPTQTVAPLTTGPVSKAIGVIPDPTVITLGSSYVVLCPATDQRGYPSAAHTACNAGAVQTSGHLPALTLKDSAAPGSFNRAGQVITYSYRVTNAGAGTLTGITITDPAAPAASCPTPSLTPGATETCKGFRAVTRADLVAGTITDNATASGTTANGVPVASNPATVTVREGWPPAVSGIYRPHPHQAEGYYLGVNGASWRLIVTHPGGRKVTFTGTVTLNAGAFGHVTSVDHQRGDSVHVHGKTLTFRFTNFGFLDRVRFATTPADTTITFTLTIDGHPATARQIFLGAAHTHARHRSPLTFRR